MRRIFAAVPRSVWLGWGGQTLFLIGLRATDGYAAAPHGEWLRIVLTYVAAGAIFLGVDVAFVRRRLFAVGLVFTAFVLVNFARIETAGSFDYGFLYENARELQTPLGRHIAFSSLKPLEVVLFLALPLVLGLVVIRRWIAPEQRWGPRSSRALAAVSVWTLVLLPLAGLTSHESLSMFVASAVRFHAYSRAAQASVGGVPFPYVRDFVPSESAARIAGGGKKPHVIMLFLESWSGRYVDRARPDGRPFTPVFDRHRREGLSYDHFYGNSVQSCRGHFATLCSLPPMYHAKEVVDLPGTRLHCLPRVLAESGYRTFVHSATDGPTFDRSQAFFEDAGFAVVRFEEPARGGPAPVMWGAGLQDDLYYPKFFAGVDAELAAHPDQPLFAVALNAAHHFPFHLRPGHQPDPVGQTQTQRDYIASLAVADTWLEGFFAEIARRPALSDALVVLVGDHSFPADEHGVHFNGTGAYDEIFRTSFMVRWPGHLTPQIVTDRAASQLDVAPTIADLVQARHRTHFFGRSLVDVAAPPSPAPLVQPYSGVFLGAVRWPYKLVRYEAGDQEHLYDLATDPEEEHDRIDDPALRAVAEDLRGTFVRLHAHEALMRANRIWPPAP